jgi:hypothetical protein
MNKTVSKAIAAAKVIFRTIKAAYIVTGILFILPLVQDLVFIILTSRGVIENDNTAVSVGNYLYLLAPLAGIMTAGPFRRFINLGGKRDGFWAGCLFGFIILAGAISLANTIVYLVYDRFIMGFGHYVEIINLLDVFGWSGRGLIVAFIQQFAVLFLLTVFFHTLAALHYCWIGLAADALLVAIISVFTPIAPLRAAEAAFFNWILFYPHALAQICACLVLGMGLLALNRLILARRLL